MLEEGCAWCFPFAQQFQTDIVTFGPVSWPTFISKLVNSCLCIRVQIACPSPWLGVWSLAPCGFRLVHC